MEHTQLALETLLEMPGPAEQETLCGRMRQDLFFIRSLPSRMRDVANFLTQRNRHRDPDKVGRQRN